MSNTTNDLGLSDKNSGAGCACCAAPEQKTANVAPVAAGAVSIDLGVTGMTCAHCVSSVTEELSTLDGVESVEVQLNVGGVSTVTVTSTSPLDPAALRAAVDEAGYSLAEV
jgi:copper chaperone CopZ